MATKITQLFVCTKCDAQSPKWAGQCLECGSWGTVLAESEAPTVPTTAPKKSTARPLAAMSLVSVAAEHLIRTPTGIEEADRVLGGGIVPGSVTLIGGEPGIGKSTLALLIAARFAAMDKVALYVSGEESAGQIKMRASRLGVASSDKLLFLSSLDADAVIATLEKERPALAIIDSIQMLRSNTIGSEAGGANQIRGVTAQLVEFAKRTNVPLLIIGHVTKDGNVAGPKTLEHLVDTVLAFEGERSGQLRVLRPLKNRFGSTDETGIFAMEADGLREIRNPSEYLLSDRHEGTPGDVISCILEGTRPILVEIQALVRKTSFGYPVRRSTGIEQARLDMLIAVLAARGKMDLGDYDVFINVVGGLKLKEPSTDLAVVLALASAFQDKPLPKGAVAWGEVGLAGEIRSVAGADRRFSEAAALGMTTVIAPKLTQKTKHNNLTYHKMAWVSDALNILK